jgi:glycosyltransferase involved in cell wall biosynthesis
MPSCSISAVIVDPQSYRNLASYDFNLLSYLPLSKKTLIGNSNYEYGSRSDFSFLPFFKYSKTQFNIIKVFLFIIGYIKTIVWIFKNRPNIVHFQWFKLPILDIMAILLINRVSKTVITAHNVLPHDSGKKYYYFYKYLYHIVSGIIVHNEATKDDLSRLFAIKATKIFVIKHGLINLKVNINEKNRAKLYYQSLINKKTENIVFSFLGSLSEYKGFPFFVESLSCNNFANNIIFLIAGKKQANKDVIIPKIKNLYYFDKDLSNEEYDAFLELSDVVVMPYMKISQSGLLLSCIEKKIPVIVSKQPGLLEPFKYGKIGWVLEINEPKELSKLIRQIVDCDDFIFDWEPVREAYSWPCISEKTRMCYEKIYYSP